jgi:alpha-L-fucosidase
MNSVGNNAYMLLNVPPTDKGVIHRRDKARLKKLGARIKSITAQPIIVQKFGELRDTQGYLEFEFGSTRNMRYCILKEDISMSQRVEKFDLYLVRPNGKYKKVYSGTVIGMRKIIPLKGKADGALLIIRQSRSAPVIESIGFYA